MFAVVDSVRWRRVLETMGRGTPAAVEIPSENELSHETISHFTASLEAFGKTRPDSTSEPGMPFVPTYVSRPRNEEAEERPSASTDIGTAAGPPMAAACRPPSTRQRNEGGCSK